MADETTERPGYLCLSRKEGEHVRIGDTITVTVTRIERGKVRLVVSAPVSVRILRGELLAEDKG